MKLAMLALGLVLLSTAGPAAELPADVKALLDRREGCQHWADEEPANKARRKEIAAGERALRCERIDKDLAALRRKYAADPAVQNALDPPDE
jgi:hypothetical protein